MRIKRVLTMLNVQDPVCVLLLVINGCVQDGRLIVLQAQP